MSSLPAGGKELARSNGNNKSPTALTELENGNCDSPVNDLLGEDNSDVESSLCSVCDTEEPMPAVIFCSECDETLCREDMKAHDKILKKHKSAMISIKEYARMKEKYKKRLCTHHDLDLMYHCLVCGHNGCYRCAPAQTQQCTTGGHHNYHHMKALECELRDLLNESLKRAAQKQEELRAEQKKIYQLFADIEQEYEGKLEQLTELQEQQFESLTVKWAELRAELKTKFTSIQASLTEFDINVLDPAISDVDDARSKVTESLEQSHVIDLIGCRGELTGALDSVCNRVCTVPDEGLPAIVQLDYKESLPIALLPYGKRNIVKECSTAEVSSIFEECNISTDDGSRSSLDTDSFLSMSPRTPIAVQFEERVHRSHTYSVVHLPDNSMATGHLSMLTFRNANGMATHQVSAPGGVTALHWTEDRLYALISRDGKLRAMSYTSKGRLNGIDLITISGSGVRGITVLNGSLLIPNGNKIISQSLASSYHQLLPLPPTYDCQQIIAAGDREIIGTDRYGVLIYKLDIHSRKIVWVNQLGYLPKGLTIDEHGRVWVSGYDTDKLDIFSTKGQHLCTLNFNELQKVDCLSVRGSQLMVTLQQKGLDMYSIKYS